MKMAWENMGSLLLPMEAGNPRPQPAPLGTVELVLLGSDRPKEELGTTQHVDTLNVSQTLGAA